jgi:hypothetical protein
MKRNLVCAMVTKAAVKAAKHPVTGEIGLTMSADGTHHFRIPVADTGMGITSEMMGAYSRRMSVLRATISPAPVSGWRSSGSRSDPT